MQYLQDILDDCEGQLRPSTDASSRVLEQMSIRLEGASCIANFC